MKRGPKIRCLLCPSPLDAAKYRYWIAEVRPGQRVQDSGKSAGYFCANCFNKVRAVSLQLAGNLG